MLHSHDSILSIPITSSMARLATLPPELILSIASFLPTLDISHFLQTSNHFSYILTPLLYDQHHCFLDSAWSAFIFSITSDKPQIAQALLNHHASFRSTRYHKDAIIPKLNIHSRCSPTTPESFTAATPLHFAAVFGCAPVCELLLEAGAKVEAIADYFIPKESPRHGHGPETGVSAFHLEAVAPLYLAVDTSDVATAQVLISHGANVNATTALALRNERPRKGRMPSKSRYRTPLHLAASKGDVEMLRLLLDNGATVDGMKGLKITPLYFALSHGHEEAAMLLIKRGAVVEGAFPTNLVLLAVKACMGQAVRTLLEMGVPVPENGELMAGGFHTCRSGLVDVVEALITHGAEVPYEQLDAAVAREECTPELACLFLEHGADITKLRDFD